MKKSVRVSLLILIVLSGIILILFIRGRIVSRNHYALVSSAWGEVPENLSFKFIRCNQAGPDFSPIIDQLNWKNNDTLHIKISYPINCAQSGGLGNYSLEDDNILNLQFVGVRSAFDACICRGVLDYEISDFPQKDVTVKLTDVGIINLTGFFENSKTFTLEP